MNPPQIKYFDHNATTSVASEVVAAMLPFFTEWWGNPSSAYQFGHQVGRHLDGARQKIAALINASPKEIIFTSCGTESNHTAIESALTTTGRRHVITTAVEHAANLQLCRRLEGRGIAVTYLPVDSGGALDLGRLEKAIRPETAIVSVMWANNETGVLFPIPELAAICHHRGVLFHTDAIQVPGKLRCNVAELGVDFLSISAHKLRGPKGIGAVYVRQGTRFAPFLLGGGQERGRRAGTENVPAIVGFGRAAELAVDGLSEMGRVRRLRDQLEAGLLAAIPGTQRNAAPNPRLPNTANLAFDGVEAEALLLMLDGAGFCASAGSACASGSTNPSHVLTAMGMSPRRARGSIRFSLGLTNTAEEVDELVRLLPPMVARLRAGAPPSPDGSQPPRPEGRARLDPVSDTGAVALAP